MKMQKLFVFCFFALLLHHSAHTRESERNILFGKVLNHCSIQSSCITISPGLLDDAIAFDMINDRSNTLDLKDMRSEKRPVKKEWVTENLSLASCHDYNKNQSIVFCPLRILMTFRSIWSDITGRSRVQWNRVRIRFQLAKKTRSYCLYALLRVGLANHGSHYAINRLNRFSHGQKWVMCMKSMHIHCMKLEISVSWSGT